MKKKAFEDLTFTDDFMFSHVCLSNMKILKSLVETILDVKVGRIEHVDKEKTLKDKYAGRGIRMDVYLEDDMNKVYDVEMQTWEEADLPRRMRYYQSMMDSRMLESDDKYRDIKDSFIIFIGQHDYFKSDRCKFTFRTRCCEDDTVFAEDGITKVYVNIKGNISKEKEDLKSLANYLKSGVVSTELTREIETEVGKVKENGDMKMDYKFYNLHDDRIREEGRAEGRAENMLLLEEAAEYLTGKGRVADIPKLLSDQDFRESILKDLGKE